MIGHHLKSPIKRYLLTQALLLTVPALFIVYGNLVIPASNKAVSTDVLHHFHLPGTRDSPGNGACSVS